MYLYRADNNWPKNYIKEVFRYKRHAQENYSKIILNNTDLLKDKDQFLPNTLFKFYRPTPENILDIENKRLWMSDPANFNDPFDCKIGYDRLAYEKYCLLKFIQNENSNGTKSNGDFSEEEIERINYSSTSIDSSRYVLSKVEEYRNVIFKILSSKSEDTQHRYRLFVHQINVDLENKVDKLRHVGIRVACFSKFERFNEFYNKNQMWSHYADNHKGFCVEYDVSFLKKEMGFNYNISDFYDDTDNYLSERIQALIKGGIFPVIYSSRRVNIPVTRLRKINHCSKELNVESDLNEVFYKNFIVKSTNWSYEKEWRIILDGDVCKYFDNKIPFPYIKTIYLGCRMDNKTIDTMVEIGKKLNIDVVLMKMRGNKFIMEEDGISTYEWEKEKIKWNNPFI
ncbi:DUF2971 domain-containing protein [Sporolactobacillus laevolacticus]|uniref:DUF2971 domain-containing protein n=1 Tax=Sporolactobacillus laevolacticus TaxID=33018 RepID=UPI0025B36846|nr:DUF2971 domain-containing protein [Sporolactobacillus laevolacticus]MDN3955818.1 DUF2971 domain-containing protein [Sporolactobacillus laevolacticus]